MKKGCDYVCYQTILKKNKANSSMPKCTARVHVDDQGNCISKSSHTAHNDHELVFKDMQTKNKFLDSVISINHDLKDLPANVSNYDIFTREMAT